MKAGIPGSRTLASYFGEVYEMAKRSIKYAMQNILFWVNVLLILLSSLQFVVLS